MEYFDAHTHLNIQFDEDLASPKLSAKAGWKEAGERSLVAGVAFVNVGADVERSKLAVEQAKYFASSSEAFAKEEVGVWATVGIHPTEDGADFDVIEKLAEEDCVVAIGECGMELMQSSKCKMQNCNSKSKSFEEDKKIQEGLFRKHIELSLKVNKPLMIHCRNAYEETYEILKEYRDRVGEKLKFNMHFFAGDWDVAQKFLELGGYLSFTGVITFADQYNEVIKKMPLDRLMSETDAPFVAPVPHRGQRNEPAYVALVAERLAELRPEPREVVLEALVANAQKFFKINADLTRKNQSEGEF